MHPLNGYMYISAVSACMVKTENVGWLIRRLTFPFSTKNKLYRGQGLGWRFSSARLRIANDTVTSGPHCFFVQQQPKMGKDWGGSFK